MAGFIDGILGLDSSLFITSAGENNNVQVGSSLFYVSVSNDMDSITGLMLGNNFGALILVVNVGPTNNLVIKNNSSSSDAANVILSSNGTDYIVPPFNTAIMGYDTSNLMWHIVRVPDSVPPGSIQQWGALVAPANWLLADGSSYLRASYPGLFNAIGTTYGAVDGTHFNVPDMRGKFALGKTTAGTGSSLAASGGALDHTHTIAHTHAIDPPSANTGIPSATVTGISLLGIGGAASQTHTHAVDIPSFDSGASSAANSGSNNPPFLVVNYIIKT